MRLPRAKQYSLWVRPLLWLQRRNYGTELAPALLWGRKPILFYLVAGFFGSLDRRRSPLQAPLRALVCVRTSQLNQCAFCLDVNSMKLAERTGNLDKAMALHEWSTSTLFDEQERAVLAYTDAMTLSEQQVTDQQVETLKNWFDADAMVELTALIAFQNLSAKFNAALDVPAQGFCVRPTNKDSQ